LVNGYDYSYGTTEIVFELEDCNDHVGKQIEGFEGVHRGKGIGKRNAEGRMFLEFCVERELFEANTWFKKTDKIKLQLNLEQKN